MREQAETKTAYYYMWAKTPEKSSGYHMLPYHLVEAGVMAGALWDNRPADFKKSLMNQLGLNNGETRDLLSFIASLHDIGKATPAFQSLDDRYKQKLMKAGLEFSRNYTLDRRHDLLGCVVLLRALLPDIGLSDAQAKTLALILGGHHGIFPIAKELQLRKREIGGLEWDNARLELTRDLHGIFGSPPISEIVFDNAAAVRVTGLVSIADWLASNSRYFPCTTQYRRLEVCKEHAGAKAMQAMKSLNWMLPDERAGVTFSSLFPTIREPHPLQKDVIELAEGLTGPFCVLIEAPMGGGKTEAALYIAASAALKGQQGLYFALPTQATSNQMFKRVGEYLKHRYGSDLPNFILLHGHASISCEFEAMKEDWSPSQVHDDDVVRISEWFTYAKRGLLSLFGVGTVDQILMAAIRTRHISIRLLGLANKVVIIDELHAYDTYMSTLLGRLLEWLADLDCSVVLLSATLPKSKSRELVTRFASRITSIDEDLPIAEYPRITTVTRNGGISKTTSRPSTRSIEIMWLPALTQQDIVLSVGEEIASVLSPDGGCCAIICNSVTRAQDVYKAIRHLFGEDIFLFHARFLQKDRQHIEARCLSLFGKEAVEKGLRPHRMVVVATQVIEQSLDLDFDLMVTELSPADLLLQRWGRLWRFRDTRRPEALRNPTAYLCSPETPDFGQGSEFSVYDKHVLLRSWLALHGIHEVRIPDDVETIVGATYERGECPQESVREIWEDTLKIYQEKMEQERHEAKQVWVPISGGDDLSLRRLTDKALWDDESHCHGTLTRLSSYPTASIVCLFEDGRGDVCLEAGGKPQYLNSSLTRKDTENFLLNSVRIPGSGICRTCCDKVTQPEAWKRSALLHNHFPVVFNQEGVATIGEFKLRADPELGILKEGVDDADV